MRWRYGFAFVLVVMAWFAIFLKNIEESGCVALNMLATDIITGAEIENRTFKISQAVGDQLYIWETDEHSICVQGKGTIYWQVKADGYQEADLVEVQLGDQSSTIYLDISLVPSPKQLYSKTDSDIFAMAHNRTMVRAWHGFFSVNF